MWYSISIHIMWCYEQVIPMLYAQCMSPKLNWYSNFHLNVIKLFSSVPSERYGEARLWLAMVLFFDFIFYQAWWTSLFVGRIFIWSNNRESPSWSRIDRFLVSPALEAQFPSVSQRRPPRLCSDNFSILFDHGDFQRSSRYFKFVNTWLKSERFIDRVKQWWDSYHFQGFLSFILACKLKALKADLRKWNEEVFDNVERKRKILLEELHVFDIIEEERAFGIEVRLKKAKVVNELERSTLMDEVS